MVHVLITGKDVVDDNSLCFSADEKKSCAQAIMQPHFTASFILHLVLPPIHDPLGSLIHAADMLFRNVHLYSYIHCWPCFNFTQHRGIYFCIWTFLIELNMQVSTIVSQNIFCSFFLLHFIAYFLYGRNVELSCLFINSFPSNCRPLVFTRCTVFCPASCCNVLVTMLPVRFPFK